MNFQRCPVAAWCSASLRRAFSRSRSAASARVVVPLNFSKPWSSVIDLSSS
jgi:hypothetical protein